MKSLSVNSLLKLILILAILCLQACIVIPTPWTEDKISKEDISVITPGLSTKEEVLNKFNEPDLILEIGSNEQVFVYKWARVRAIWVAAGGYNAAVGSVDTDEALLILFDETDHVKRIRKGTKSWSESYGEFMDRCLIENKD